MKKLAVVMTLLVGLISPISADPASAVVCPAGYNTYGQSQCINQIPTAVGSVTSDYSCPNGGTLSGQSCIISSNFDATYNPNYYCPNDLYGSGTLSGSTCSYPTRYGTTYYPNAGYSCSAGVLVGSQCKITQIGTVLSCPNNYSLSGGYCYYNYYPYGVTSPSTSYTYTDVYSNATYNSGAGVTPIVQNAYSIPASMNPSYTCPSGTLSGTTCIAGSTSTIAATLTYSGFCPVHYSVNAQTGICEAVPYTPDAFIGPTLNAWLCTSYNYDGTSSNYLTVKDESINSSFIKIDCTPAVQSASVIKTYLCISTDNNTGERYWITSNTDISGSTSTTQLDCQDLTSTTKTDVLIVPDWQNQNPDIPLCTNTTYLAWLACAVY